MITAGELDQRITIQSATEAQNTFGEPIQTWATLATVWARIEALRGAELLDAAKISTTVMFRVRVRHRTDVTPKQQVLWGIRTLNVEAVLPSERRNEYLDLMCAERL